MSYTSLQNFFHTYKVTPLISFFIYLIAAVIVLTALITRQYNSVIVTDALLLTVHSAVLILESYKHLGEYVLKTEHFTDVASPKSKLEVILIKAEWCAACNMYLSSGIWKEIMDAMKETVTSSELTFSVYDLDTSDPQILNSLLHIDSKTIPYVPIIYIRTPEGIFQYNDNIYNADNMIHLLNELVNKFIFS